MAFLGFSIHNIMSSVTCDNFTYSFPIWMSFISFSYLITLAGTSNTMLNKSDKSECPYLVPDLRRGNFSFPPLNMMFAVALSDMAFIMLRSIPSISALLRVLS